jgi:hypothetical protein
MNKNIWQSPDTKPNKDGRYKNLSKIVIISNEFFEEFDAYYDFKSGKWYGCEVTDQLGTVMKWRYID